MAGQRRAYNSLIGPQRKRGTQIQATPWREDIVILRRMGFVEELHLKGYSVRQIARALDIAVGTAHNDITRCNEMWHEQLRKRDQAAARAKLELSEVARRATAKRATRDRATRRAIVDTASRNAGLAFHRRNWLIQI